MLRRSVEPVKRQLLLITGMHRSGTSFITSLCNTFGLALPENLVQPDRWNPRGYFESTDVLNAQERLLASLGRGWFDLQPFPENWLNQVAGRVCLAELRAFLDRSRNHSSVLVVKDPRSSLMIPLWTKLADEYDIDLRILIVVRRPGQVARSLDLRDHMNPLVGMALWWTHTICALQGAMGRRNAIAIYEDVLRRPKALFDLLRNELGLIEGNWTSTLERRALDCVDDDLNHVAEYASIETTPFYERCDDLYQSLSKLSSVPRDFQIATPPELDAVSNWFPEWRRLFVRHLDTMTELERQRVSASGALLAN